MDNAIWVIGSTLENELEAVEGKKAAEIKRKRDQILRRWIPEAQQARKYRDPANG